MENLAVPLLVDPDLNKQGQTLRRKGKLTRQKFLDATFELLHSVTLEEVIVPNIAAKVGLSTATFYLYFSDIDELYLELAHRAGDDLRVLREFVETPWPLNACYEHALKFVAGFLNVVRLHRPVIHLRNARADRDDKRFDTERLRSAHPLIVALGRQVHRSETADMTPEMDFSECIGAVLFTGMERLSIRLCGPDSNIEDVELLMNAQAQIITDCITSAARTRHQGHANLPGRN
jgi:AcrR family transcriptional regulator